MARIRQIKPEFWNSPSTARASAVARLTFIGMWNWADDAGRGTANPKELEGFIFPNDDIEELSGGRCRNFRDVLAEVSSAFGVVFYEVSGRPYYAIPSWQDHQRNERIAQGKHPGPEEADRPPTRPSPNSGGTSDDLRPDPAELPTISGLVTGEQGNRGTEEQGRTTLLEPSSSEPPTSTEIARIEPPSEAPARRSEYPAAFVDFWAQYPRHEGKRKAFAAWQAALRRASAETIAEGAARYNDDPNRDPAFTAHPTTWLNRDGWDDAPLPQRRPSSQQDRLEQSTRDTLATLHRMGVAG